MIGTLKAATYFVLAIGIALLLLTFSGRDIDDISASDYEASYSVVLSDTSPHANADVTSSPFNVETGASNANWLVLRTTTSASAFMPSMDSQIPDGSGVGKVNFNVTLGLINTPCNTSVPGSIPMIESTTDIFDTADFEGTGTNLVMDDDNDGIVEDDGDGEDNDDVGEDDNGLPTYVDHYPSFLNLMFDPDGPGPKPPIRPRARYMGHQVVVDGVPPTFLQLVVFNPGDLGDSAKGLPEPDAALSDAFGFPTFVIVNNPTAAAAPSAITDWCATDSDTILSGLTEGRWEVSPNGDGPEPIEFDRGGHCFGAQIDFDNDGDGVDDDGCLFLDASPGPYKGVVRTENPAPLTGIYGTGTHIVRSYSQSYRDADDDGISNDLDPCTTVVDGDDGHTQTVGPPHPADPADHDADGINWACDLDDFSGGPYTTTDDGVDDDGDNAAYEVDGIDNDADTVIDEPGEGIDEDPFDNKDNDGDGMVDEDGGCTGVQGLPDADQDCFPNRGDNCAQTPADGSDLDITVPSGPAADYGMMWDNIGDACDASGPVPETGADCLDALDNDGDGRANDGCPIIPTPPNAFYDVQNFEDPGLGAIGLNTLGTLGSCEDGADNGGDTVADVADPDCYDGQEWGAQCQNFIDDDGDNVVNDGCPAAGGGTPAGHYHTINIIDYVCIPDPAGADDTDGNGNSDNDGDGACDSTEDLLGSDKDDNTSKPEYAGLEYDALQADNDGNGTPESAPGVCNDKTVQPGGAEVDNDGDGDANAADFNCGATKAPDSTNSEDGAGFGTCGDGIDNAADGADLDDTDCWDTLTDTDQDGVPDSSDNCASDDNPSQQDTDGDGDGDDCDTNDDGDASIDTAESYMGTDPKDNCADDSGDDANPSDADQDADIDVGDVIILFFGKIFVPANYSPRSDLDADGDNDVGDVIIGFFGKIFTRCEADISFTNNTGQDINDIYIEFFSRVVEYKQSVQISDDCGASPWTIDNSPISDNTVDASSTSNCADGGTVTVKVNTKRTPVIRCYDWTLNGVVVNGSDAPCTFIVTGLTETGFGAGSCEDAIDNDGDTNTDTDDTDCVVDNIYKLYLSDNPWEWIWTDTGWELVYVGWGTEVDIRFSPPITNGDVLIERQGTPGRTWWLVGWSWTSTALSEDGAGPGTCGDGLDNGPDGDTDGLDTDCWVP